MKKALSLILTVLLCMAPALGYASEEQSEIHILCLGSYLEPDVAPFYSDSRIMAPVRAIFEAVGAEVTWDDSTNTAKGVKGDTEVCLTLGSNVITINGENQLMDTALVEKDDRVFAPIRFVAESFGYKVSFHEAGNTAVISSETEYEYFPEITVCLPLFESVTDSSVLKTEKSKENIDIYYYSYNEDYVTEYLNTLQSDFGYVLRNISFDNGSHIYEYEAENGNVVRIEDYYNDNGTVCIRLSPDAYGNFGITPEPEEEKKPEEISPIVPQYPEVPQIPEVPSEPVNPSSDNPLDYSAVTGSALVDIYHEDGELPVYQYEYNQFSHMRYESFLSANGWYFYDLDFDIDTFTNTIFYTNGTKILSVSTSHMFGVVMIVYPAD